MAVRGVRGATCLARDDAAEMVDAVSELVAAMLERNGFSAEDVISVMFTSTPDLVSMFPAAAARAVAGFADVPLMCACEIAVPGSLPRAVRVMMHVETTQPRDAIQHVYLRGAEVLRQDLLR